MGWFFRKTVSLGPIKLTFSKSGISISIGTKGARTGINSGGERYSSVNIPGTGLRYQKRHKKK
jgi:Protein of unknown function (DUF4236)